MSDWIETIRKAKAIAESQERHPKVDLVHRDGPMANLTTEEQIAVLKQK